MTGLIPWRKKTQKSMEPFNRALDTMHERFFQEPFLPLTGMFADSGRWRPSIDIREKGDEITVTAEIPGMEKEDINVSISGRFLTIRGEKSIDDKKEKKRFFQQERSYGYFERSLKLPAEVDDASVKAKYKRGVLTLKMKKSGNDQGKLIHVTTGKKN